MDTVVRACFGWVFNPVAPAVPLEPALWLRIHSLSEEIKNRIAANKTDSLIDVKARIIALLRDLSFHYHYTPVRMQRSLYERAIHNIHLYATLVLPDRIATVPYTNFMTRYLLCVHIGTPESFIGHDTVRLDECGFDAGPKV